MSSSPRQDPADRSSIPGAWRNVGVWDATDATELHSLISSLPAYSWITAEVTALARHPLESEG